ncbi:MAG: hypothetical protein K5871_03865 [Lachnospiraceae bacterium]|nr:hypothetical protein [Lachnospiraceae bacterium]
MENEIKKLRRSLMATQTICILMLAMFLVMIVVMLRFVSIFNDYKDEIDTTFRLVKQLEKVDLPRLAEDIHTTAEAINAVNWPDLSERLNDLNLQELRNAIESLDLDQINDTLASLNLEELVNELDGLDIQRINEAMENIQTLMDKLDRFGFF